MTLKEENVGIKGLLSVPGVTFAYMSIVLGIFNFNIYSAILPLKLAELGYQNKDMGFV